LERETEVMSLFFCGLLWTGMDGSPSTGWSEVQLGENAVSEVIFALCG
jgi:hypothetical protein